MFREGGHATATVTGNRRTVRTTWDDGAELVEEYDTATGELLGGFRATVCAVQTPSADGPRGSSPSWYSNRVTVRKRRAKTALGAPGPWEHLTGERATAAWNPDQGILRESSENPVFSRKDTCDCFQWRVRNLPYPTDNYQVKIDHVDRKVVIRTANKKYFKRFDIPELDVLGLPLSDGALSWSHAHATLIVSYAKPPAVLRAEARDAEEARRLRAQQRDDDAQCKQQ